MYVCSPTFQDKKAEALERLKPAAKQKCREELERQIEEDRERKRKTREDELREGRETIARTRAFMAAEEEKARQKKLNDRQRGVDLLRANEDLKVVFFFLF